MLFSFLLSFVLPFEGFFSPFLWNSHNFWKTPLWLLQKAETRAQPHS